MPDDTSKNVTVPLKLSDLKLMAIAAGYRFEISADGTEERMIRPDGSVAVTARKPPASVRD